MILCSPRQGFNPLFTFVSGSLPRHWRPRLADTSILRLRSLISSDRKVTMSLPQFLLISSSAHKKDGNKRYKITTTATHTRSSSFRAASVSSQRRRQSATASFPLPTLSQSWTAALTWCFPKCLVAGQETSTRSQTIVKHTFAKLGTDSFLQDHAPSCGFPAASRDPQISGARVLSILPTMRTPQNVSWHRDLVYTCMWSLLVALKRWNEARGPAERIRRVLMTGLATGTGGIVADVCAQQMVLAVKHFQQGLPDHPRWPDVLPRSREVDRTTEPH
ncbi:hypothetical protein FA95DRAFT_515267 [Auriscalpium vulgare]|uniref:Uncharacterized protein n=1 Tax=Auriscalpium vulgare TaxID=40419 RepID=A0ACB8RH20_9AGAM|nr:hypothetical protein FA95DRAFT_515267 [Auriscalpium vulgare]